MKKLFLAVLLMAVTLAGITSCEDDNSASASVHYEGCLSGITFDDSSDVDYYYYIHEALASRSIGLVDSLSIFKEEANVDYSSVLMAVAQCDAQAVSTYQNKLSAVKRADVISAMQVPDSLSLDSLDGFTITYSLYSGYSSQVVTTYEMKY